MTYFLILYWVLSAIYCGASTVNMRLTNISLVLLLLTMVFFAPVLCWVFFGMRLARGQIQ